MHMNACAFMGTTRITSFVEELAIPRQTTTPSTATHNRLRPRYCAERPPRPAEDHPVPPPPCEEAGRSIVISPSGWARARSAAGFADSMGRGWIEGGPRVGGLTKGRRTISGGVDDGDNMYIDLARRSGKVGWNVGERINEMPHSRGLRRWCCSGGRETCWPIGHMRFSTVSPRRNVRSGGR